MSRRWLIPGFFLLLAATLSACGGSARMAAPTELASVMPAWQVEQSLGAGWQDPFSFGPYTAQGFRQGWSDGKAWAFLGRDTDQAWQPFEYQVATSKGGEAWHCNCAARVSPEVLGAMAGPAKPDWPAKPSGSLACSLRSPQGILWRLALASGQETGSPMRGVLQGPKLTIAVRGTNRLEGEDSPSGQTTGYVFRVDGPLMGPVGAVQVIDPGLLWLPDSPDQGAMAAASAALLLQHHQNRK
ncbi:hypothetical protein [Desulfoferula mesophila]|uniref:Lipoprotein n=1 Tax=Desulfoferula mesophila TaxID=3058419 RepID=A0AAU9ED01_9BACT|nr:hypothetical protein FAK_20970 [Desulfoferula mesophilus]